MKHRLISLIITALTPNAWAGVDLPAQFVRAYDGDTLTVNLVGEMPAVFSYEIPVRVAGIDTPEMNAKAKCEQEMAKRARELLSSHFEPGDAMVLRNCQRDKYFRLLCDVVSNKGADVAQAMLFSGLAKPYSGGTKQPFNCR